MVTGYPHANAMALRDWKYYIVYCGNKKVQSTTLNARMCRAYRIIYAHAPPMQNYIFSNFQFPMSLAIFKFKAFAAREIIVFSAIIILVPYARAQNT